MCTKYIHGALSLREGICTDLQKVAVVKRAWYYGHENGLLSKEMYTFGIQMLKLEDEISKDEYTEVHNYINISVRNNLSMISVLSVTCYRLF